MKILFCWFWMHQTHHLFLPVSFVYSCSYYITFCGVWLLCGVALKMSGINLFSDIGIVEKCGILCSKIVACILTASISVKYCAVDRFPKSFSQPFNSIYTKFILHVISYFDNNDFSVKTIT